MARDWDKLAGESGRDVPEGRLGRLVRMGRLGVSVSASTMARKVGAVLLPGDSEARQAGDGRFRTRQAEKVLKVLGQMKGATMKVGQILSADPDLLPPEFIETLTQLQHQAPPMTWRTVKAQVERAFDRSIEDVFRWFDHEPLGAASIGQVHRGTLRSGEDVAVKVQYPGVASSLESDLSNLGSLLQFGRVLVDRRRLDDYLGEVRSAILAEADYEAEGRNLAHFAEVLAERDGVRAPRPFLEWTRPTVLTMEYVAGDKLDEALESMEDQEQRAQLLLRFIGTYVWMFHERFELHADPHPGNFILDAAGDLVILDFGCVKQCDPGFADGVLDIMDACWQRDDARASRLYRELGFGRNDPDPRIFDPALLRAYHEIALAPFLHDEAFDFATWDLRRKMQAFVMEHPAFLKLVPPAEGLLVFRVMSGIKGLLAKSRAHINVHRMAVETAARRGRLTGPPRL
ncbi:MAG: AarF/ABC1/UbiB kinase family protein [Deltaproteobacteria bacterium]|nr:AarF/ABC1/UbiB kinase family protein [Deltaproteobacteria bacterium]MCB9789120.1 AarF/ABC1/UbiB kinase family protein [Deltaproteobacteria bacterium]